MHSLPFPSAVETTRVPGDAGLGARTRPPPVGAMPWPEGCLCHLMTLRLGTGSPVQLHEAIRTTTGTEVLMGTVSVLSRTGVGGGG